MDGQGTPLGLGPRVPSPLPLSDWCQAPICADFIIPIIPIIIIPQLPPSAYVVY